MKPTSDLIEISRGEPAETEVKRVVLLGNPNTGKTTTFNRLSGLRHKTSNFPGTTQDARIGMVRVESESFGSGGVVKSAKEVELVDLPGVYSLELDQSESEVCRRVLAGTMTIPGARTSTASPDAAIVVVDSTNLSRNLLLVGEVLRRRLPTVIALNMIDLARKRGANIDMVALSERLGCEVVAVSARSGEGLSELRAAMRNPRVPNRTPPGTREGLEQWADEIFAATAGWGRLSQARGAGPRASNELTDRFDRLFTHPVLGLAVFVVVMLGLFYAIFSLAQLPASLIETLFAWTGEFVRTHLKEGALSDFLADGVIAGISGTVVFVPQICLLFFLISILEDTGYLARAAFMADRWLRPFGLSGHAFVPLLSSHACALPGILSTRGIPDGKERLAAILVAPFMSCSARIPVYVLLTGVLFPDSPAKQAAAFAGCYALGLGAGLLSALVARRTIAKSTRRPMILELPSYKIPSLQTAFIAAWDRGSLFLKKAGTNILAICVVLWWLSAYPKSPLPEEAAEYQKTATVYRAGPESKEHGEAFQALPMAQAMTAESRIAKADELDAAAAAMIKRENTRHSFAGRLGHIVEPVFRPLGFDWQLSVGVITSFAAREVFVSTMAIVTTGSDDVENEGILARVVSARRTDVDKPIFTRETSWSLLVYYVLAMQCLPTLVLAARESGGMKWAALQLVWMCGLAYVSALVVYQSLVAIG